MIWIIKYNIFEKVLFVLYLYMQRQIKQPYFAQLRLKLLQQLIYASPFNFVQAAEYKKRHTLFTTPVWTN